jgi:hypothetical protein
MSEPEGEKGEDVMIMTVQGPISPAEVTGIVSCHEYLLIHAMQFRGRQDDNMVVEDGTDLRMLPVSMNILGKLKEDPFCCLDNCVLNQEDNAEAELRCVWSNHVVFETIVGCGVSDENMVLSSIVLEFSPNPFQMSVFWGVVRKNSLWLCAACIPGERPHRT